jgi:hypothetical protein
VIWSNCVGQSVANKRGESVNAKLTVIASTVAVECS